MKETKKLKKLLLQRALVDRKIDSAVEKMLGD